MPSLRSSKADNAYVQLQLPWTARRPSAPRAARRVVVEGSELAVEVVRHHRARRYVVRVGSDGGVRLTVPRGASIAGGLAFASGQAPWIARERRRQLERSAPWRAGTLVWWRGELTPLTFEGAVVQCGGVAARLTTRRDARAALEHRWLAIAAGELPARCLELAATCSVRVTRVSVRNQRSRWGACSSAGVITLNWRLVQMPLFVRDYVIFHELMHVRQPNHSRRFWREVDSVCVDWREAERWLRRHGKDIL